LGIFSDLKREDKEAIAILQIGTFLEYFDLMLYVHMAVLLNELFFPKTDPHTAALLSAFAFCSTYFLRPFGALIFGYIGDHIGRKTTVIFTTMMMSTSCIIMANLPTYEQIGIVASWVVTLCRIVQGLSSMGEIIGAQIYVTEITRIPVQYPAVSFISAASSVGTVAALGIAALVTTRGFNWRLAFWIGAVIAMVGIMTRVRLRETPEFINIKRQKHNKREEKHLSNQEIITKESLLVNFLAYCGWPLTFYLAYMYFNPVLKAQFDYSSDDIIFHNLGLSIVLCIANFCWAYLSYYVYPLKILKIRGGLFVGLTLILPLIILYVHRYEYIFILQALLLVCPLGIAPGDSIFIRHFPVLRRFTATSILYALTRAVTYVVTSFGLVYLTIFFGHWGVWLITFPAALGYFYGVKHFGRLDEPTRECQIHTQCSQGMV
jgi:MFS transporter, MHS family, proline/betaine transporter